MAKFSPNAEIVLRKRYLQPSETPDGMLERISLGNSDYLNILQRLDFLPNSPAIWGTRASKKSSLAACYVLDVPDSMEGIMDTARVAALVQKFGGGVGYCLSNLRPKGAPIATTQGAACGPVAVLCHLDSVARLVTQGGKRAGAQMGILSADSPDILEFVHCKDEKPEELSTFNISVACTDTFMTRAMEEPGSKEGQLLQEMAESAWKTGDPGVFFVDSANKDNPTPYLGEFQATNPCAEQPLLPFEVCTLGSINVANFVIKSKHDLDWDKLRGTVCTAVQYLDELITESEFPDPRIVEAVRRTRKIGLGVMGWADALALLNIHYDTKEAVGLGERLMRFIKEEALAESERLARSRGSCPAFSEAPPGTKVPQTMRRNACLLTIAPTGSISILAGCSPSIEPHYSLEWSRTMGDGTVLQERIPVLARCGGFTPKVAHEIPIEWRVRHQAAFQKHVDSGISQTINIPNNARVEDVRAAFIMLWKSGCKGGTIFRDGCRESQVLTTTTDTPAKAVRRRLPDDRPSFTHRFRVGDQKGYITVGLYEDGSPGEIFLRVTKEGSTVCGLLDAVAVLTSIALQHGVPLDAMTRKLTGTSFEPAGMTENPSIPTALSVPDYVYQWLGQRFNTSSQPSEKRVCPECGLFAIHESGCWHCRSCGWERCS